MKTLQNFVVEHLPLQHKIPVSKKMREKCGYSEVFIDIQQKLNGALDGYHI